MLSSSKLRRHPGSLIKNALQVVWKGESKPAAAAASHRSDVLLHVHRHQYDKRSAAAHAVTPPSISVAAAAALQLSRPSTVRCGLLPSELLRFVPTYPMHLSAIYAVLSNEVKEQLSQKQLRTMLEMHYAVFSRTLDGLYCASSLSWKLPGYGESDGKFLQLALDQWDAISKVVNVLPLTFTPISYVIASYEDFHHLQLTKTALLMLDDICEVDDTKTMVRMKSNLFLPNMLSAALAPLDPTSKNSMLSLICQRVPINFVHSDIVNNHMTRKEIQALGFDGSPKRLLLSEVVSHALEWCGPFVRLAPTFSHAQLGAANGKYNAAEYDAFAKHQSSDAVAAKSATGKKKNKGARVKTLADHIRCLLPAEPLGGTLPAVKVHVCTTHGDAVAAASAIASYLHLPNTNSVLGLDAEWVNNHRVALLQLSTATDVFLIRLVVDNRPTDLLHNFPDALKSILCDPKVLKAGVGVHDDSIKMRLNHQIPVKGSIDVREMMLFCGYPSGACSLEHLVQSICRLSIDKPAAVTRSNWEASTLTPDQQKYAAEDAFAGYAVASALLKLVQREEFGPLVDQHSRLSMNQLNFINVSRRIRKLIGDCIGGEHDRKLANEKLEAACSYSQRQELLFILAKRFGPESACRQLQDTSEAKDDDSGGDFSSILAEALADAAAKKPAVATPEISRQGATLGTRVADLPAPSNIPPVKNVEVPSTPPPTTARPAVPAPSSGVAPAATRSFMPPAPPSAPPHDRPAAFASSGSSKLLDQFMQLQRQRGASAAPPPQRSSAEPTVAAAALPPMAPAAPAQQAASAAADGADGEADLEELQREFDASGLLSQTVTIGFSQPVVQQIPVPPPQRVPQKKSPELLPPTTKKWAVSASAPKKFHSAEVPDDGGYLGILNSLRSASTGGGGQQVLTQDQMAYLTTELLRNSKVPPLSRKIPNHNPLTLPAAPEAHSPTINVEQLLLALHALKS